MTDLQNSHHIMGSATHLSGGR